MAVKFQQVTATHCDGMPSELPSLHAGQLLAADTWVPKRISIGAAMAAPAMICPVRLAPKTKSKRNARNRVSPNLIMAPAEIAPADMNSKGTKSPAAAL